MFPKKFSPMIREVFEQYDIHKVYADKAYDDERSFNLLALLVTIIRLYSVSIPPP
jgi:hypothetical protein